MCNVKYCLRTHYYSSGGVKKILNASRPSSIPRQGGKTESAPSDTECVNMLCISTKERKHVS